MGVYSGPEIVNSGLVLHLDAANSRSYPGSGTNWSDLSGNSNTSSLVNGSTISAQEQIQNYGCFFGSYLDSVTFFADSDLLFTGDLTVEAWVYLKSYIGFDYNEITVLSLRTGSSLGTNFDLGRQGSAFSTGAVNWWNRGTQICSGNTNDVPLNTLCHIAWVRSGTSTNNCKIYVNGVLKAQGTNNVEMGVGSGVCYIGNSMYVQPLNGYIKDLRISNTAKYTQAFTPPKYNIESDTVFFALSDSIKEYKKPYTLYANGFPFFRNDLQSLPKSIAFDGINDYVSMSNSSSLRPTNEVSVSFWIRRRFEANNSTGWIKLFGNTSYFNNGYLIFIETGAERYIRALHYVNGTEYRCNTTTPLTSSYQYVTFTFKTGDAIRSYFNAIPSTSTSLPVGSFNYNTTNNLVIGGIESASYFDGFISSLTIYNRVLSATEIKQNFEATRGRYGI